MKLKKITRKMSLLAGTACLAMLAFVCPMASLPAQAASGAAVEATVQPRAHDIRYVYKIEDGKMYKRLYNYSTGNWVDDDWIYVCDYPG